MKEIAPNFQRDSWQFTKPNSNIYQFSKNNKEFQITIFENDFEVLIPLKESDSVYKTNFNDSFSVAKYLIQHLDYHKN